MPKIYNDDKNVCWQLDLLYNDYIDIDKNRPDTQNWIPFNFILDVNNQEFKFNEEGTCFTIWETKKIVNGFEQIITAMKSNPKREIFDERFQPFKHTCYEVLFDIKVSDADDETIQIELWLNGGYINKHGYDSGFRFNVSVDNFEKFTFSLKEQFNKIQSIADLDK